VESECLARFLLLHLHQAVITLLLEFAASEGKEAAAAASRKRIARC
jgi:hypothetical protein